LQRCENFGFSIDKHFLFFSLSKAQSEKLNLLQGCQMVSSQAKNNNMGIFWRALEWKMLIYILGISNMLWALGNFVVIWYIYIPHIGILYREKYGKPLYVSPFIERECTEQTQIWDENNGFGIVSQNLDKLSNRR
jgi:hypothetical protein